MSIIGQRGQWRACVKARHWTQSAMISLAVFVCLDALQQQQLSAAATSVCRFSVFTKTTTTSCVIEWSFWTHDVLHVTVRLSVLCLRYDTLSTAFHAACCDCCHFAHTQQWAMGSANCGLPCILVSRFVPTSTSAVCLQQICGMFK